MAKERRLGRGLAALLGEPSLDEPASTTRGSLDPEPAGPRLHDPALDVARDKVDSADRAGDSTIGNGQLIQLPVDEIDENPFQPRREFGETEIASLAESLREHDMLQPVLVRRLGDRWQLISGERRLRAAVQAGWTQVPAQVREADDRLVAELAIVENLQRKDLNPIEKALSFQRYLQEHDCTQDDLGKRLKIDRSTIANLMRLLELPTMVQESLRSGVISAGHARALLPLGEEPAQIDFCNRIRHEGLSVRDVERQVQEKIRNEDDDLPSARGKATKRKGRTPSQQLASLEQELRVALGTKVEIRQGGRGRGQIVVHFSGHDEFDRLKTHIVGESTDPRRSHVG